MQLSDFAIGTHDTPNRMVPGDGDIPLARIIGQLLDAGYAGVFDIEIVGPRIDDEGYESAITRSVAAVQTLLEPPDDELTRDVGPEVKADAEGAGSDDPGYDSAVSDAR